MTEFGKSPYLTVDRLRELGYSIVIFPGTAFRVANKAVEQLLSGLKEQGTQVDWLDRIQTRTDLYELIDYDRYEEKARRLLSDT